MKSFTALRRHSALAYLFDWMTTALDIFWKELNRSFHNAYEGTFKTLRSEMNDTVLAQVTKDLKSRSSQILCRMADENKMGSKLRFSFLGPYLDELARNIETQVRAARTQHDLI